MNTRLLLFIATVAISVIGSTVALADETVYASPLTCAQASGELTRLAAPRTPQHADNAAAATQRAKAAAASHVDS